MATKEDVEAYSAKYGDPTSGGVVIREADSDRAKAIGATPYSADTNLSLVNNQKLYQNEPNKWEIKPSNVGVTLNEETGDINIRVPDYVANSPSYKAIFSDNSILKNLSAAYKANKDVKYPDPLDETKEVGVKDLVSRYDKYFKDYVDQVNIMEEVRYGIRQESGNDKLADALTEKDFMLMRTNATGESDNDSSLIAIPKTIQNNFFDNIKTLAGYNTSQGVISKGDFREGVWNLGKTSGDDIVDAFISTATRMAEIEKKEDITTEDAEEYARIRAFLTYIQKEEPEAGFWESLGVNLQGIGAGLEAAAHNVGGSILAIGEGVANIFNFVLSPRFDVGGGLSKDQGFSTVLLEDWQSTLQDDAAINTRLQYIHADAAALNSIVNTVGTVGLTLLTGNATSNMLTNIVGAATEYRAINQAFKAIGSGLGAENSSQTVKALSAILTSDLGGVPTTSTLLNAAQSVLNIAKIDPAKFATSINTMFGALSKIQGSQAATEVMNKAMSVIANTRTKGTVANIVAQVMVDTMLTDAVTLRKIIDNQDSTSMGDLLKTLAIDATTYGIGFGVSAFTNYFPESRAGRSASARTAQKMAKGSTAASAAKEKIKSLVLRDAGYINNIKDLSKRQVAQTNALVRQATRAVASAGVGKKGWEKTLDIEQNLNNLRAVQKAIDFKVVGVEAISNQIVDPDMSPEVFGAWSAATQTTKEIQQLEAGYGINTKENINLDAKIPSPLTKLTDNYIGAVYAQEYIEGYQEKYKTRPSGIEDDLTRIAGIREDFESKYPKIAEKVPAYLDQLVKQEQALQNWKLQHGLITEAQFAKDQERALAARGYIHTQRIKPRVENESIQITVLQRAEPTVFVEQHYKFGSKYDYANMYNTFLEEVAEVATVANSRQEFDGFTAPTGTTRNVLIGGGDYERAQTVKKLRNNLEKEIINSFSKKEGAFRESLKSSKLSSKLAQYIVAKQTKLNADAKAQSGARKISRAKVKPLELTRTNKSMTLQCMSPDKLSGYAVQYNGNTFTNISQDDFDYWVNPANGVKGDRLASKLRKEIKTSIAKNSDFITDTLDYSKSRLDDLPKIKTSSYKKLMGIKTLKDADPAIRPYLSESGVDLESGDWGQWFSDATSEGEGGGASLLTADGVLERYTSLVSQYQEAREGYKPTYDNFQQAINFDPELPIRLDNILLSESGFMDSDEFESYANQQSQIRLIESLENAWQKDLDELADAMGVESQTLNELQGDINNSITEYIYSGVLTNTAAKEALYALASSPENLDIEVEYTILSILYDNIEALGGELAEVVRSDIKLELYQTNLTLDEKARFDVDKAFKKFSEVLDDVVYERRNNALQILREAGSPLANDKGVFEETRKLMKEIEKAESQPDIIIRPNEEGQIEVLETSPLVASLVKYSPIRKNDTWWAQALNSKAFQYSNRLFRLGTTGINAKSMLSQWFKDTLNAYVGGGSIVPLPITEQQISQNFGSRIAEHYRLNMPKIHAQFERQAKESGRTVGEVAARYEMALGSSYVEESTESANYRLEAPATGLDQFKRGADKTISAIEKVTNDFREKHLRESVYAHNMQQGLARGYDLNTARNYALRAMFDATTDFNRMTYHLQALTSTVPYLRAGINGTKSFWRLMSLDPVGLFTRLTTGIIIPVIAATISILRDDENREYYKTLYEREKDGNFMFVVNGKFYTIPLPEEVGAVVAPFRQWIEQMYDANRHDFWELAINDLVGIFPYDLTGYQDIDGITLAGDPTALQRLGSLGMGLLATTLPPIGKTAFELTYGVDPYTGKKIDKSYTYLDEDGNLQIMDSTTSEFAKALGQLTGWSPSVISTIVTNFVGQTGSNILDSIVSMAQWVVPGGEAGNPLTIFEKSIGDVSSVLTVTEYDRTKAQWNNTISTLFAEKETYTSTYQDYSEQILAADTIEKRQALIAKRNDYIAPFIEKVKTSVERLQSELGGSLDSYRFAAVVSLMNFGGPSGSNTNSYSRLMSQEGVYDAKAEARMTIERMNIANSPSDQSLLGHMYQDSSGNVKVAYYTPLEILNAQSIYYTSTDIFETDLLNILEEAGITLSQKAAGYSEQSTPAEKKQYKKDWNAKVAKTIAPYVQKYGVENIFRYSSISETLDDYFYTDTYYNAKNFMQSVFGE